MINTTYLTLKYYSPNIKLLLTWRQNTTHLTLNYYLTDVKLLLT